MTVRRCYAETDFFGMLSAHPSVATFAVDRSLTVQEYVVSVISCENRGAFTHRKTEIFGKRQ
jgi:hypothetical protein